MSGITQFVGQKFSRKTSMGMQYMTGILKIITDRYTNIQTDQLTDTVSYRNDYPSPKKLELNKAAACSGLSRND